MTPSWVSESPSESLSKRPGEDSVSSDCIGSEGCSCTGASRTIGVCCQGEGTEVEVCNGSDFEADLGLVLWCLGSLAGGVVCGNCMTTAGV